MPRIKRFLSELKFDGMAPTSLLFHKDVGHSQEGTKEVTALMEAGVFDGPKPIRLLIRLLTLANLKADSIVLDFFSGFRVIIVIEANSYVNIRSSRLLPKFKTQKINSWCAA